MNHRAFSQLQAFIQHQSETFGIIERVFTDQKCQIHPCYQSTTSLIT